MRIIHMADIHLESAQNTNLNILQAEERNAEILETFIRVFDYAEDNSVDAILIAGDLFDTEYTRKSTVGTVLNVINRHRDITVYYLHGNHDRNAFSEYDKFPENLIMFSDEWSKYVANIDTEANINICGIRLTEENKLSLYDDIPTDDDMFNIVMLHGADHEYEPKAKGEDLYLKKLRNAGIDYLALGHVHKGKCERLDERGVYAYPGCLEGRGFDECGVKGFLLLDIDEATRKCEIEFVPFAKREIYNISVDISSAESTMDIEKLCQDRLDMEEIDESSIVRITLCGEVSMNLDKDLLFLQKMLERDYYTFKIKDETKAKVSYKDFYYDVSLAGEFARLVMDDASLSEEDKAFIVKTGINALKGEAI